MFLRRITENKWTRLFEWRAESNSITQLGYKADMFIQPAGCKGYHSTKLAHQQAKMLQICKPGPYIFSRIFGIHLHIHYPSGNSFAYCPSPGACIVHSRGLPLVVVGMKSEVFLMRVRCLPQSDLFTVHWNRSQSFTLYGSFLYICTADHEMLRCRSPSLVFRASLFTTICSNPRPTWAPDLSTMFQWSGAKAQGRASAVWPVLGREKMQVP